ncbi:MAG: hypothetical protein CMJ35_10950 [Phycisphaerae bacterium]|nr:hypothetical protein [Phycisphaerae bacterium]MBM92111.1 hypothetical protein [Phycisphaerae bacterium]
MGLRVSILLCLGSLAMVGCAQRLNDRLTLGGQFVSPSLDLRRAQGIEPRPPALFSEPVRERSGWRPTPFVVQLDGVVHGHRLALTPPLRANAPAREYGRYPSPSDVLDPQRRSWSSDLFETGRELGRSLIGGVYAVGYLTWTGQLHRPTASPMAYKRTRQDEWSSGQPAQPTPEPEDE